MKPASMRTATVAALLAVLCCVTVVPSRAMNYVVEIPPDRMDGTGLLYAHLVDTNPIWDPRTIWSSVYVTVNCSVSGYKVLTANSVKELSTPAARSVLWCGWRYIINAPTVCDLRFSIFRSKFFAVQPPSAGLMSLGQPALKCSITAEDDTTWGMVRNAVTTAIATEAFFHAHWLSRSQAFRLTSGGLIGVTSVALLGCLYVLRNAPAKKYLAGGLALSAGATWAFLRWCISHARFLSIREVLLSPVAVWYIIITGTAGVAVTYWIDHPDHYKLHNTIRMGLQLVALVFVYNSFPDQGLAIAAVLFLICCAWLVEPTTNLVRTLGTAVVTIVGLATRLFNFVRRKPRTANLPAAPPKRRIIPPTQLVELPEDYVEDDEYESSQDSDYNPDTTDDIGEDDAEDDDEGGQGDAQRSSRQRAPTASAAAAPGPLRPHAAAGRAWSRFGWGRPAHTAAAGAAGAAAAAAEELAAAPSFDEWAQPSRTQAHAAQAAAQASLAGAGAAGDAGAGRAPGPSPRGWGAPMLAVDRAQGTNYQQQQPAAVQRPTSSSTWSEKKVVDFSQPRPVSPPAAAQHAAAAAAAGAGATPKTAGRKVENPETGREITISGSTFRELLARGYEYDAAANKLVLTAGAQASPAPAVNVRGAPTPSSNLRSRRSGAAV